MTIIIIIKVIGHNLQQSGSNSSATQGHSLCGLVGCSYQNDSNDSNYTNEVILTYAVRCSLKRKELAFHWAKERCMRKSGEKWWNWEGTKNSLYFSLTHVTPTNNFLTFLCRVEIRWNSSLHRREVLRRNLWFNTIFQ